MPTFTIDYTTDAERLELERAIAYLAEMRQLGSSAAHGTVLDTCEKLALGAGRRFLRDNLKATMQARADAQKKAPGTRSKGRHSRNVMTALGLVRLSREYVCGPDENTFPADDDLGIHGFLTTQARRMATLAGVQQPFAKAQMLLNELCGWNADDETIRLVVHAAAKQASSERPDRSDATGFAAAPGEIEVPIDAG